MASLQQSGKSEEQNRKVKVQFSLKWKISLIFSIVISILFFLTLEAITIMVTFEADQQVKADLQQALEGAASGVDVEMLLDLAKTGQPNTEGFSDDPRYLSLMGWLDDVHAAEPDAWPYLYIPSEREGYIYFVVDLYAIYDPESSSTFMEEYQSNSGFILIGLEKQTFRAVDAPIVRTLKGWADSLEGRNPDSQSQISTSLINISNWLAESNLAPPREFGTYEDQFGRWASGYMPLENSDGTKVAGIGVDFHADLINQIRDSVRESVRNTFLLAYLVMLPLVFIISIKLTKPIVELTTTAAIIKTGTEKINLTEPGEKRNKDEIDVLEQVLFDTYAKLQAANLQMQGLSHQLISDREDYRTELARNLHDHVLSYLSVLSTNQPKEIDQAAIRDNYKQVIERLRTTIFTLRSPMLEYGIPMALEDYLDNFSDQVADGRLNLIVNIEPGAVRFDNTTETHIFRIIQQSVDNALEHAKATEIEIVGKITEAGIRFAIKDNGESEFLETEDEIDISKYKSKRKYGIVGMNERAVLIGAELEIKPNPGNGTIVEIIWQP